MIPVWVRCWVAQPPPLAACLLGCFLREQLTELLSPLSGGEREGTEFVGEEGGMEGAPGLNDKPG